MRTVAAVGIWMAAVGGLQAQSATFVIGNAHYEAGRFDSALVSYETVLQNGFESAGLHYNIGNVHFKLGNLGQAALGYERALRLNPRHTDAEANRELVSSLAIDDVTPLPGFWPLRIFRWWVTLLGAGQLAWLAGLGYVLATLGIVGVILSAPPSWRAWAERGILTGGGTAIIFGATLVAREFEWGQPTEGIVLVEEVTARSAPVDDASLGVFTIHEATKVRIDDRSETWVEIVLEDGQVGWIEADAVEII
jgi:tetratricopeptide (TPR) repeat protein